MFFTLPFFMHLRYVYPLYSSSLYVNTILTQTYENSIRYSTIWTASYWKLFRYDEDYDLTYGEL